MSSLRIIAAMVFMLVGSVARGEDIRFFESGVEFWKKPASKVVSQPQQLPAETKFSWATYLDPKNDEFFREGDYLPPRPFMEIVRNPSDENLALWFRYIEQKNSLSTRLSARMQEFINSGRAPGDTSVQEIVAPTVATRKAHNVEPTRFRFRLYFDSSCPHCQKMLDSLAELHQMGFFVEARQIDAGPAPTVPYPLARAGPQEVEERKITAVPLLLIADATKGILLRVNGFVPAPEVLTRLSQQ